MSLEFYRNKLEEISRQGTSFNYEEAERLIEMAIISGHHPDSLGLKEIWPRLVNGNRFEIVKLMLECKSDPNLYRDWTVYPIVDAINDIKMAKLLHKYGLDLFESRYCPIDPVITHSRNHKLITHYASLGFIEKNFKSRSYGHCDEDLIARYAQLFDFHKSLISIHRDKNIYQLDRHDYKYDLIRALIFANCPLGKQIGAWKGMFVLKSKTLVELLADDISLRLISIIRKIVVSKLQIFSDIVSLLITKQLQHLVYQYWCPDDYVGLANIDHHKNLGRYCWHCLVRSDVLKDCECRSIKYCGDECQKNDLLHIEFCKYICKPNNYLLRFKNN